MISLKQAEAFYWVGTLGNHALAAAKIHVAQSTVSKRILELEAMLGVELFDRGMRAGRLTSKGNEVLQLAEKLLRLRDRIVKAADNADVLSGTMRIGVTELVALTWLPALIGAIRVRYPQIMIEPVVDLAVPLYRMLDDRSLDLVIGPKLHRSDMYDMTILGRVEQVWVCSPDIHPGDRIHPPEILKSMPLLAQPQGSASRMMINHLLDDSDIRLKATVSCNSMVALAEMAASGLGVTCVPRDHFEPDIRAGRLKILVVEPALPELIYSTACRRDAEWSLSEVITEMAVELCAFTPDRRRVTTAEPASMTVLPLRAVAGQR